MTQYAFASASFLVGRDPPGGEPAQQPAEDVVGYLTLRNPSGLVALVDDLAAWCQRRAFVRVADLTGAMIDEPPRETFAAAASPIR